MTLKPHSLLAGALLAALSIPLQAQPGGTAPAAGAAAPASQSVSPAAMTLGEVRRLDREAGKITLRHEAILNLDMPAMTMSFQLRPATLADALKVGDKVRFVARKEGGLFLVTAIERAD